MTVRIPSTSLVNLERILHPLFLQPFFVTMHCNIFFRWWVIFIVVHWTQLLINVSMISLFSPNTTLTLSIQYIHPFLHALTSLLPHLGLCNYSDWLITTSSPSSSLFSLYFIWAYVTIRIGSLLNSLYASNSLKKKNWPKSSTVLTIPLTNPSIIHLFIPAYPMFYPLKMHPE